MIAKNAIAAAVIAAMALIGSAGTAAADPIDDFCDRGPRDGKAVVHRLVCG